MSQAAHKLALSRQKTLAT
jgi:ATP-binding cassette subfamily C (CFTR/MRP) protein 4